MQSNSQQFTVIQNNLTFKKHQQNPVERQICPSRNINNPADKYDKII
jgi:hypothetical protein